MAQIKFVVKELNKPSAQTLNNFNKMVYDTISSTIIYESTTLKEFDSVIADKEEKTA